MADPKKRLGDNPLSPYRSLVRGNRTALEVSEAAAPAAPAAGAVAAGSAPRDPAALEAPTDAPASAAPTPTAAHVPIHASDTTPNRAVRAPSHALPVASPPEAATGVTTPTGTAAAARTPGQGAPESVAPAAADLGPVPPIASAGADPQRLAAAVDRRRRRRPEARAEAQGAAKRSGLPLSELLGSDPALRLFEALLHDRADAGPAVDRARVPYTAPVSPTGTPADITLAVLQRASLERNQRKRQKTVYLSDELCERLRTLAFEFRVDQSIVVEEALAQFFRWIHERRG